MKRTWAFIAVIALACACVLGGCGGASQGTSSSASASSSSSAGQASSEKPIDFSTGTPWIASNVEGAITESTEARMQDDFNLAINKDSLLALKIPDGFSTAGTIDEPDVQRNDDLQNVLANATPDAHDPQLACNLYGLLLDWDSRNKLGVEPFKQAIEPIEAISSIDDLGSYIIDSSSHYLKDGNSSDSQKAGLWLCSASVDFDNPETYLVKVSVPNLLMTDSAEYENETTLGTSKREARCELATKVLVKSGYTKDQAAEVVKNCLDFESKIAPSIYTQEQLDGPDYESLANNHYTRAELEKAQGVVPVAGVIDAMGYPASGEYLVEDPAYLDKLNSLYVEENITLIKDYYIVHTAIDMAGMLDRECYEWEYACSNVTKGTSGMLSDEGKAADSTAEILVWPTAMLYADAYLTQEDKDRLSKLTDEAVAEYHNILADADFLSEETKANAIEKLDAMRLHILYPDDWGPYSCDELNFKSVSDGGTLCEALDAIRDFNTLQDAKMCSEPVDRDRWTMAPTVVNCCYEPSVNGIFILGAFARCDVYRSDMSDEEMYAKMGAVIGHEISHAFDSSGAQYDKDGRVANWWTDEDLAAFKEKNAKMVAYYDAMHPWEGQNFHGSIMTGEACADMAGVKCMLNIAKKKENFDYDTFFRSFANLWLRKFTQQKAYLSIENVHPMAYLRINATLQQYDEFLNFYNIAEGDKMYLAPEDRVAIW